MTITMQTPGLREHIESRLIQPRPDCLIWSDAVDRGYGRIWVDGSAKRVHRVMWELVNGPIADDLTVDHLCQVRSCVNTEHMELVTAEENARRAGIEPSTEQRRPRSSVAIETHCRQGHEYSPENTRQTSKGRCCIACAEAANARRRARRAAA